VVRRHLNLVYSAALRKTAGDAHLAQDVSQKVFVLLARKASALSRHPALAGWLYTTTHFTAAKIVRTERRRQNREQEAQAMQDLCSSPAPETDWNRLRPMLDDVMHELSERDREAILVRFFEGRPFAEVGARQGLTENAARMRVERALEKLHTLLARRGITSTTTALALLLADHAVIAAPAGLVAMVSGAAVLAVGIGVVLQQQNTADLRAEVASLQQQTPIAVRLRAENQRLTKLQVPPAELEQLRKDSAELAQVRADVAALKARLEPPPQPAAIPTAPPSWKGLPVYAVNQLDEFPWPTVQAAPVYPLPMLFDGSTGEVTISFIVDTKGDVIEAAVTKSSDPAFEDSALAAVRSWKFAPGKRGGQPVNTRLQVPIVFSFTD
jgi:RNA polymerase sigma factor (sigma-70 family)